MTPPQPLHLPNPPPTWTAELAQRALRHLALKTIGLTIFMTLFFVLYFQLLRHPARPAVLMPLTALDHWLPFQPEALWIYVSLWLYVGIAPNLVWTLRELVGYGLWIGALCVAGLACFYLWPTAVPQRLPDVTGHAGFALLQGVDAAGNACPSLHVATAVFSSLWIDRLLRTMRAPNGLRWINAAWMLAIAWSTLAIRQHVALDALAGAALGTAFALASLSWHRPRPAPGRAGRAGIIGG